MGSITLYHGTDARIVEMTIEERQQYIKCCNLVIDNLHPLFKPLLQQVLVEKVLNGNKIYVNETLLETKYKELLNEKGGKYMYLNLSEKLMMLECRNNNVGLYQYNDLYLCAFKSTAMNYAQRSYAGGEIGLNAYRLIQGYDIIFSDTHKLEKNVSNAMDTIREFAKESNERPAIVTIEDVDINYLSFEDGRPFNEYHKEQKLERIFKHDYKFRYTKPIELSQCVVEPLTEELFYKIKENKV